MPVCKAEAHRALELLEDYYSRLGDSDDKQLRAAIERVIRIFKSRLFQALLDIQEFYELTLMDESKSSHIKTSEALQMASRWELAGPPGQSKLFDGSDIELLDKQKEDMLKNLSAIANNGKLESPVVRSTSYSTDPAWEYDEISLDRGTAGLGFSIAGGTDNPHVNNDTSIFITKLIDGGAAAIDGRLRVNDIITHVNNVCVVNVPHCAAVDALKKAGNNVHLKVKRKIQTVEDMVEVELIKGSKGLGFTIAGGIGNQHIPGDNGIYVTKVMEGGAAAAAASINVGDRLVAVKNLPTGDFYLENCTHEEAVQALKASKDRVVLLISKVDNHYPFEMSPSPTIDQMTTYKPRYPVARSISEEELVRQPRTVSLTKGPAGLGFNIVGGEDGEGIFISFILAGGPADASGHVRRGDQILTVNGIDLTNASHEAAAKALKGAGNTVHMKLQFRPDEYHQFEAKIHNLKKQIISGSMLRMSEKKSLYVRSLFDYDPSKDEGIPSRGLMFKFGDILHVTNASDEEWWQARKVLNQGDEGEMGLVPSRSRWERKVKARDRSVRWRQQGNGQVAKSRKSPGIAKKLHFIKKKDKIVENENGLSTAEGDSSSQENKKCHTYREVQNVDIDYTRPVLILGLLRDWLSASLSSHRPESFQLCLLHTTRPRRDGEVEGVDYHFVDTKDAMDAEIQRNKFVSVGKFNGNYYGTNMATVRDAAEGGKHGVINIPPQAIRRLREARIHPITIFVRPTKWNQFLLERKDMCEDKARERFETVSKLEKEFWEEFSAVVEAENKNCIYEQVKSIIASQSEKSIWLSIDENI